MREDGVGSQTDQLLGEPLDSIHVSGTEANFKPEIFLFAPSCFRELLTERRDQGLPNLVAFRKPGQQSDDAWCTGLLRARRKRTRRGRTSKCQDEIAPPHCVPSGLAATTADLPLQQGFASGQNGVHPAAI